MKKRGKGIACVIFNTHPPSLQNSTSAVVEVRFDGTVKVLVGSADIGQGSTTILAQIAAEELGVPIESISMYTADTELTPFCSGSYGSRVTYVAGNAVRLAAAEARETLFKAAANLFKTDPENIRCKDGKVFNKDVPEKALPIVKVALFSYFKKGSPVIGSASYHPEIIPLDLKTGQGIASVAYSFGAQIAEVEVDTETGEVRVLKMVVAHDVGRAINPAFIECQFEGGVQMGIGYALMEEVVLDHESRVLNPNLTDYTMPSALDVPDVKSIIVESNEPTGPFGAKGIGEAVTTPTAPAIINAIYDAVGVRITSLPATPEKILKALR